MNPLGYISELMKVFFNNGGKFISAKVEDFGFQNEKFLQYIPIMVILNVRKPS